MPNLLPVQWKETLERVQEKTSLFLKKLKPEKKQVSGCEHITADLLPAFMQSGRPILDMHETAGELIITAEVPGFKKEDLTVELVGSRLVIRGEKRISRELKGTEESYLSECSYGSFARSVQLPYEIKDSTVKAGLKNGVLTIRMPKQESQRKWHHRVSIS